MSGMRHGVTLLLLAAPFAVYAAWQIQGVSHADLLASDPPSDKGLPAREQLASTHAKTTRWAGDVRKAAAVTFQFRAPGVEDTTYDEECTALSKAAAKRAADLTDLEKFLSGVDSPTYTGTLRNKYLEWQSSKGTLTKAEKAVEDWFAASRSTIETPEAAAKALAAFGTLVADYARDARFSDPAKAAAWKIRARVEVMKALESVAEVPFARALELPLPLESASADVRKALGTPRAIREQAKLLQAELTQADEAKLTLPIRVTADAKDALKRANDWAARERLLGLFAEPKLFSDPTGAAAWLAKVNAQFECTASPDDRALLRRKVQEFCEAFIPSTVQLDEFVLLDGKRVPRAQVEVKHFPSSGGASMRVKLSADTDRQALTEFTVAEKYPGDDTLVMFGATEHYPKQLQPTNQSQAAIAFQEARKEVGSDAGPKWSAKSIEELQSKCKPRAMEVNKLKVPGDKADAALRLMDRLESLAKGAAACPQLFEKGPK